MRPRKAAAPAPTERKPVRCAIYTRKSTEEGLEQEFNSLDAQRESAEAYITSQKAEGWQCLPDRYDDGGFSGGSLERPALKALMKDIEAGKIDCVVVYKVDRLSRSLMDFSRIVEVFERQKVSFVSVTQAFNTRDSMGRLMLNVLLSFAQFEREIIGERIRDKISMQRRRGKWTGGKAVLGYDVDRTAASPKLVVNDEEAKRVREVYALYLQLGSLMPLMDEVARRGWTTKRIRTRKGAQTGGAPLSRNALHAMLTNRIYLGKISHRQECFDGEHPAIVDQAAFDAVQAKLQANGRAGGNDFRNRYHALLKRILRCRHCGCAMTHVFHGTERKRYRYYTCSSAMRKGRRTCPQPTLPAADIEDLVVGQLREYCRRPEVVRSAREALARSGTRADSRLASLLVDFEAVWAMLEPAERVELVKLAVASVEFDAADGSVEVTFHGEERMAGAVRAGEAA